MEDQLKLSKTYFTRRLQDGNCTITVVEISNKDVYKFFKELSKKHKNRVRFEEADVGGDVNWEPLKLKLAADTNANLIIVCDKQWDALKAVAPQDAIIIAETVVDKILRYSSMKADTIWNQRSIKSLHLEHSVVYLIGGGSESIEKATDIIWASNGRIGATARESTHLLFLMDANTAAPPPNSVPWREIIVCLSDNSGVCVNAGWLDDVEQCGADEPLSNRQDTSPIFQSLKFFFPPSVIGVDAFARTGFHIAHDISDSNTVIVINDSTGPRGGVVNDYPAQRIADARGKKCGVVKLSWLQRHVVDKDLSSVNFKNSACRYPARPLLRSVELHELNSYELFVEGSGKGEVEQLIERMADKYAGSVNRVHDEMLADEVFCNGISRIRVTERVRNYQCLFQTFRMTHKDECSRHHIPLYVPPNVEPHLAGWSFYLVCSKRNVDFGVLKNLIPVLGGKITKFVSENKKDAEDPVVADGECILWDGITRLYVIYHALKTNTAAREENCQFYRTSFIRDIIEKGFDAAKRDNLVTLDNVLTIFKQEVQEIDPEQAGSAENMLLPVDAQQQQQPIPATTTTGEQPQTLQRPTRAKQLDTTKKSNARANSKTKNAPKVTLPNATENASRPQKSAVSLSRKRRSGENDAVNPPIRRPRTSSTTTAESACAPVSPIIPSQSSVSVNSRVVFASPVGHTTEASNEEVSVISDVDTNQRPADVPPSQRSCRQTVQSQSEFVGNEMDAAHACDDDLVVLRGENIERVMRNEQDEQDIREKAATDDRLNLQSLQDSIVGVIGRSNQGLCETHVLADMETDETIAHSTGCGQLTAAGGGVNQIEGRNTSDITHMLTVYPKVIRQPASNKKSNFSTANMQKNRLAHIRATIWAELQRYAISASAETLDSAFEALQRSSRMVDNDTIASIPTSYVDGMEVIFRMQHCNKDLAQREKWIENSVLEMVALLEHCGFQPTVLFVEEKKAFCIVVQLVRENQRENVIVGRVLNDSSNVVRVEIYSTLLVAVFNAPSIPSTLMYPRLILHCPSGSNGRCACSRLRVNSEKLLTIPLISDQLAGNIQMLTPIFLQCPGNGDGFIRCFHNTGITSTLRYLANEEVENFDLTTELRVRDKLIVKSGCWNSVVCKVHSCHYAPLLEGVIMASPHRIACKHFECKEEKTGPFYLHKFPIPSSDTSVGRIEELHEEPNVGAPINS